MYTAVISNLSDVEFSNIRLAYNIPIQVSVFKEFLIFVFIMWEKLFSTQAIEFGKHNNFAMKFPTKGNRGVLSPFSSSVHPVQTSLSLSVYIMDEQQHICHLVKITLELGVFQNFYCYPENAEITLKQGNYPVPDSTAVLSPPPCTTK